MRFFGLCVGKKHGYFRESPENQRAEAPASLQNSACCACFADSRNKPELLAHFKNLFQPGV